MKDKNAFHEPILFAGITLALSYLVFWGPIALFGIPAISFVSNIRGPIWATMLFLLGGCAPSLVGIILTRIHEGSQGLRSLLNRSIQFNLGMRWYAAMTLIVLLVGVAQILINSMLGSAFNYRLFLSQLPSFIPLIIAGPISEEFGWRGYLLIKLQHRWNALASSIVVGIVWGLWHLPLFYMVGTSQHELHLPFLGFVVGITAISIVMTWVNNNTNNNIWAAIFFHWIYTYVSQVNASGVTRSITYNALEYLPHILIAIAVILIWKPMNFDRTRDTRVNCCCLTKSRGCVKTPRLEKIRSHFRYGAF